MDHSPWIMAGFMGSATIVFPVVSCITFDPGKRIHLTAWFIF